MSVSVAPPSEPAGALGFHELLSKVSRRVGVSCIDVCGLHGDLQGCPQGEDPLGTPCSEHFDFVGCSCCERLNLQV